MRVLKAACRDQPQPGALLAISGSIFSSTPVTSANSSTSATPENPGLSPGAKVGIGLGVPALVLTLFLILGLWYQRKKYSPSRHRRMDERWGDHHISSPVPNWAEHRANNEQATPPSGRLTKFGAQTHASVLSSPRSFAEQRDRDQFLLQELPTQRQKRPTPAVTVDTTNVFRGRIRDDPSPHSLFG